jgi:spore coat protein U-like protein
MKTTMGRLVAGVAAAGLVCGLVASQTQVQAATATANLPVSANVVAKCTIAAPNTLTFTDYDPVETHATADLDATTTIAVACTKGASGVTVGLGLGSNATGSTRRMAKSGEYLTYEIYSDSGRSQVWGNSGSDLVSYSPTSKASHNLSVYGRVAAGQDVSVGTYNDTVVATINF